MAGLLTGQYFPAENTDWTTGLKPQDRTRLRQAVKRVHMQYIADEFCTNREADRIIETLGPQIAEKLIKQLVDGKIK